MNLKDLPELENIFLNIEVSTVLTKSQEDDFIEIILTQLDDFILNDLSIFQSPKFKEKVLEYLYDIVEEYLDEIFENETIINYNHDKDIEFLVNKVFDIYFSLFMHRRSYKDSYILYNQTKKDKDKITKKINIVREKDKENDGQKTIKWFEDRHNLLSASNIWKALKTQSSKNSLIYEKCLPCEYRTGTVNINSSLHWGHIYEPLAQEYYEHKYNAEIEEYGCIKHSKYHFLGASPDGINVNYDSDRYGRMLEIKSVVSRKITGIPKLEYWVQTQLQMECCDLNECDFLECKFIEYENYSDFIVDNNNEMFCYSKDNNKHKGVILCFINQETNEPKYEYCPFLCKDEEEYLKWRDEIIDNYVESNYIWVRDRYWKLDVVSCVLIMRNKDWFNYYALKEFENTWKIIVKEREDGYEHRKPKSKNINKEDENSKNKSKCLISLDIHSENLIKNNNNVSKEYKTNNDNTDKNNECKLKSIEDNQINKISNEYIPENKNKKEHMNKNTDKNTDKNKKRKKRKNNEFIINIQTQ